MQTRVMLDPERVSWRDIDGEIIAVDLRTAEYLSLNNSAALLWQALVQGSTATQLVDRLTTSYGVDETTAAEDVDSFVAMMRQRGLVRQV